MNILHLEPERYSLEALSKLKLHGNVYEFSCNSQSELMCILEKNEYESQAQQSIRISLPFPRPPQFIHT